MVPALDEVGNKLVPFFETLLPTTIFLTLFVTFSKVNFHQMRLRRWHFYILAVQLFIVAILTLLIQNSEFIFQNCQLSNPGVSSVPLGQAANYPFLKLLLEAVLICVIAPCASASPVVTAKLGGDLTQMTTFVLLSSIITSVLIPAIFPLLEPHQGLSFGVAFWMILKRLTSVLLLPLALGSIVRHCIKPLYNWFMRMQDLGFYIWSLSLAVVVGLTLRNIVHSAANIHLLIAIAVFTLFTAILQFVIGRMVGRVTGDKISTGQGMFQKNTGLAIWIAYVYLTPEASIGAGCYVLWQNIINSIELRR